MAHQRNAITVRGLIELLGRCDPDALVTEERGAGFVCGVRQRVYGRYGGIEGNRVVHVTVHGDAHSLGLTEDPEPVADPCPKGGSHDWVTVVGSHGLIDRCSKCGEGRA